MIPRGGSASSRKRALAALNHPNIVAIHDVGENYIVTELVDGEPLRRGKFALRKTVDVCRHRPRRGSECVPFNGFQDIPYLHATITA